MSPSSKWRIVIWCSQESRWMVPRYFDQDKSYPVDGWCPTDGQHGIIPLKDFGPQEIFLDPIARPSQRRNEQSHRQTFVEKEKEKRPSQRRGMRNFPRLASVQVLSFGYSRDMLEYPRREGCDHPCREECGCFSNGKWADTLLWPRNEQPGTQTLTMWNGQLALDVFVMILCGSWKGTLVLPRIASQLLQFMWDDQE